MSTGYNEQFISCDEFNVIDFNARKALLQRADCENTFARYKLEPV